MSRKSSGVLSFLSILVLTFAFYCILKLMTQKNDNGPAAIEAAEFHPDGRMSAEDLLALGRLSDPQMSPDGSRILYGVSYTSVEENRACRQIFVCNRDGSGRIQLSHDGSSISNARWFDDRHILFLQKGQIWSAVIRKDGKLGRRTQLSQVEEGISEFAISPDKANILYISTVKGSVKRPSDCWADLPKADAYEADDLMNRHWDHWVTDIPHSYVAALDIRGKQPVTRENSIDLLGADCPFELPTEPFGGMEQLSWNPDGRHIAYSCRRKAGRDYAFSTDSDIYIYDILSGATVQVCEGGGYDTDPVWSPDGGRLAWISMERDGYEADQQRLMLAEISYGEDGMAKVEKSCCISAGFDRNVAGPVWENPSTIWFNSLVDGLQAIYRAVEFSSYGARDCDAEKACGGREDISGWALVRVTAEDDWHDYGSPFHIEPDGIWCSSQSMNRPTELVKLELGGEEGPAIQAITDENGALFSQLEDPKMEARMIRTVDGKDMLTWVMYPPHFDPSKTYPAITICLGGPQGTISQSWSYRWCYRLMAEQGYIVVLPNRRGTTAFGQEWCEQISGDYAGLNIEDYKSAARALKAEPYVGKMAACGASYGGYSVYYLAGHNEDDLFDCFIAHAGIFNEEQMYYSTEEMWFPEFDNGGLGRGYLSGSPWSKLPEAQKHYSMSPHKFVENWHTPILCIHGAMDFRIPYEQGLAAFNCARMMGVEARLIVFPEENHWILSPQNALFWHRSYFEWLDRWCR